jgi:uncharacterized protein (DUF697 family)
MTADTTTNFNNTSAVPPVTLEERLASADAILRRNVLWACGAGVLPLPLFDMLAVTAIQIKLIKQLSDLYGLTFREDLAKKLIASLLTGVVGVGVGIGLAASLSKLIPVIGTAVGVVTLPVIAGAATHATGKVFIMHFEAGGTLLDFDVPAMRAHFKAEFDGAKDLVTRMYAQEQAKPSDARPPV